MSAWTDGRWDEKVKRFFEAEANAGRVIEPRYSGIATFMRAPLEKDLNNIDIALIGVPFDLGVTNRPGARLGPREMRSQSTLLGFQNHQSKIIPFLLGRVADLGDVPLSDRYSLAEGHNQIEQYYKLINQAGIIPISAGGDHSISYPILKALGATEPVGLIHIDAHCDTGPALDGTKFHHGGPFRNAVQAGVLDPKRTIQIGIRGGTEFLWNFSYQSGMRVIHIEEFYQLGLDQIIAEVRRIVGDGPTYISFDVDGLDPVYAPGTGTPEIGGLTSFEAQQLVRGCQGLNLIGGDVVEVSPPLDPSNITALVGATMLFEILCVVADSWASRKK